MNTRRRIKTAEAWLVDDDYLLKGKVEKSCFVPVNPDCGFSSQKVHVEDIGKIIFYDKSEALKAFSGLQEA